MTRYLAIALLLLGAWMLLSGGGSSAPPSAVVYTYEKDTDIVPAPVIAALNAINRAGIRATLDEVGTTDGPGDVPDQYKVSRPAAIAAELPALVVLSGDKVSRVVKAPQTQADVLEAVGMEAAK
jgi:hypothetical protein